MLLSLYIRQCQTISRHVGGSKTLVAPQSMLDRPPASLRSPPLGPVSRALLRASIIALTLALTACGAEGGGSDAPVKERDAEDSQIDRKEAAVVPVYDRDGVLSRSDEDVFDAPLPRRSSTTMTGGRWAGFQNTHHYNDVVKFYRKNLGSRYNIEHLPGGTRMRPVDGQGTEIYITRPRRPGRATRIYYYGEGDDLAAPPFIQDSGPGAARADGPGRSGERGEGGRATERRATKRRAGGDAEAKAPDIYNREVRTNSDGSKTVVLSPRGSAPRTSRNPGGAGGAGGGEGGQQERVRRKPRAGAVRRPIPDGVLY